MIEPNEVCIDLYSLLLSQRRNLAKLIIIPGMQSKTKVQIRFAIRQSQLQGSNYQAVDKVRIAKLNRRTYLYLRLINCLSLEGTYEEFLTAIHRKTRDDHEGCTTQKHFCQKLMYKTTMMLLAFSTCVSG